MKLTSVTRSLNKYLDLKAMKVLDRYSHYHPSPLTMQQFIDFGKSATEEDSFNFLKKELPLRLAIITSEMDLLPSKLQQNPTLEFLQSVYCQSFQDLVAFAETSPNRETLDNYCQTLKKVQSRNHSIIIQMAKVG